MSSSILIGHSKWATWGACQHDIATRWQYKPESHRQLEELPTMLSTQRAQKVRGIERVRDRGIEKLSSTTNTIRINNYLLLPNFLGKILRNLSSVRAAPSQAGWLLTVFSFDTGQPHWPTNQKLQLQPQWTGSRWLLPLLQYNNNNNLLRASNATAGKGKVCSVGRIEFTLVWLVWMGDGYDRVYEWV